MRRIGRQCFLHGASASLLTWPGGAQAATRAVTINAHASRFTKRSRGAPALLSVTEMIDDESPRSDAAVLSSIPSSPQLPAHQSVVKRSVAAAECHPPSQRHMTTTTTNTRMTPPLPSILLVWFIRVIRPTLVPGHMVPINIIGKWLKQSEAAWCKVVHSYFDEVKSPLRPEAIDFLREASLRQLLYDVQGVSNIPVRDDIELCTSLGVPCVVLHPVPTTSAAEEEEERWWEHLADHTENQGDVVVDDNALNALVPPFCGITYDDLEKQWRSTAQLSSSRVTVDLLTKPLYTHLLASPSKYFLDISASDGYIVYRALAPHALALALSRPCIGVPWYRYSATEEETTQRNRLAGGAEVTGAMLDMSEDAGIVGADVCRLGSSQISSPFPPHSRQRTGGVSHCSCVRDAFGARTLAAAFGKLLRPRPRAAIRRRRRGEGMETSETV